MPTLTWSNVSGAGGIYSSVHDLTKWMRVQLDGGVISGEGADAKRLFSDKRQREMWSILTPMPISDPPVPELAATKPNFQGYGEGWVLSDYRGDKLVSHTGGWPGMVSRLTLVPDKKLGVIVLTSQEVGSAFNAITMRVLDAYLGAPKTDWVAAYAAAVAKAQGKADDSWKKHLAARDANIEAFAAAAELCRHVSRPVVRRCRGQRQRQGLADAVREDRAAARRPRALAARHLHRALARSRPECRCLPHLRARCGRQDHAKRAWSRCRR